MFGQILWTEPSLEPNYNLCGAKAYASMLSVCQDKRKKVSQFESLWEEVKKDN